MCACVGVCGCVYQTRESEKKKNVLKTFAPCVRGQRDQHNGHPENDEERNEHVETPAVCDADRATDNIGHVRLTGDIGHVRLTGKYHVFDRRHEAHDRNMGKTSHHATPVDLHRKRSKKIQIKTLLEDKSSINWSCSAFVKRSLFTICF